MLTRYNTDGTMEHPQASLNKKKQVPFGTLQKLVDGFVEVIPCEGGMVAIVDEDGALKNLPVNHAGTDAVNALGPKRAIGPTGLYGPVLVAERHEVQL